MKQNKLILFDWGNIVESHHTGYDIHKAYDDTFHELGYKGNNTSDNLKKYKLTAITNEEDFKKVYEQIKIDLGLTENFEKFKESYKKYFDQVDYYTDVRDYEVSLGKRCYIGVLSNLNIFDGERLDNQLGLKNYDYVFKSYEIGIKKPYIGIFEAVQSKLPFDKKDILFIDDVKANIETAKEFGWNAYQLDGMHLEDIKKVCEEFLIEK